MTSRVTFTGDAGNTIVADYRPARGPVHGSVILAHGGGQTRHSWGGTARALAERGWHSWTVDQRGHGESDWVEDSDYSFAAYGRDLTHVAAAIQAATDTRPALIGASLGGLAGLHAAGAEAAAGLFSALVLVDVTPHVKADGVRRILGFMGERAEEGFASLEEAADAIAAYLPHRPRPANLSGLAKNLRLHDDGRYRWHWDPRFLAARADAELHADDIRAEAEAAARHLAMPVLLVRGRESELVGEDEVRAFLKLVPGAEFVDVSGARHMVAGDRNDVFTDAVTGFLDRLVAVPGL